jgi:squalene-associated FAD-dependent desaturase
MNMPQHVVIIGGGLAGMSAASALASRELRVTLLEARPRWGGRASSITDRETGETIDNCQHVSMGCCTNFSHFCRATGIDAFLQKQPALHFVGPDGAIHDFSAGWLPAPLHLLPAFGRLSYLSRNDVKQIRTGLRALCRERETNNGESFAGWLQRHNQGDAVVERFWRVVLVSALSESLDRIDIQHARKVFVDGFLANRHGWEVSTPTVPLGEFYGQRLADWFARQGATLRLQAGVKRLLLDDGRIAAVELRDGERMTGDHFVLAVPQYAVRALLPDALASDSYFANLDRIETAPISSVHLWFDRPITELPHAVFVERISQWLFNRSVLGGQAFQPDLNVQDDSSMQGPPGQAGKPDLRYYQVVISASRELLQRPQAGVIAAVVGELKSVWPAARDAALVHSRLITEHKAVFSPTPGIDALRPPQQSRVANLQLAGDWTATGWPATMEGAVRSGYLAAENVLRQLGREERVLQPDLPTALLSRLLLGL